VLSGGVVVPALAALALFLIKLVTFYFIIAIFENAMARVRFLKAPSMTWAAMAAAILSFVFYLANV
jgi:formate hydrogenlyase subunit 4